MFVLLSDLSGAAPPLPAVSFASPGGHQRLSPCRRYLSSQRKYHHERSPRHLCRPPDGRRGREAIPCMVAIDASLTHKAQSGRTRVITIEVNGALRQIDIEPDTPLLWVLRDVIGLMGTKFGCGIAQCGACTVHIDGTAMRSCSVPIGALDGAKVLTIEGLSPDNNHPVQRAWIEEGVPQCGYCQSGQIMAVVSFLKNFPKPTDADIDANITNICRCGTYQRLRRAVHRAADMIKA